MRWRSSAAVAALAVALAVTLAGLPAAAVARAAPVDSPVCVPRTERIGRGLAVTGRKRLTDRATELTFASTAMQRPVHAVVLLPTGYAANRSARYPVLYVMHGHGGQGRFDWIKHGVEAAIGGAPVIVVVPEGGYDGYYSDWYGTDVDGHTATPAPAWETFHIGELLPWVDANYRTTAARGGRAITGNSMGGFGSMSYAARHPDLFVAAGAFSGAVDTQLLWPAGTTANYLAPNAADGNMPDFCIWGDPVSQRVRWQDHNPTTLAANLGALSLYQRTGDGQPGRYDDVVAKQPSPGAVLNEFGIGLMNHEFDNALNRAGIPHTAVYEHGVHDWPYWMDDLREFLPLALRAFAAPRPAPPAVPFTYTAGRAAFSVWDWRFRADHDDEAALVTVDRVGRRGLVASGGGVLRVDTAPLFVAGARYLVVGHRRTADAAGRLHFTVTMQPNGAPVAITAVRASRRRNPSS
ncbi:MAG: esterase family protein [Actinobacteria bacterium]|nr:esterase family protein [Actinomycetota bacterium]